MKRCSWILATQKQASREKIVATVSEIRGGYVLPHDQLQFGLTPPTFYICCKIQSGNKTRLEFVSMSVRHSGMTRGHILQQLVAWPTLFQVVLPQPTNTSGLGMRPCVTVIIWQCHSPLGGPRQCQSNIHVHWIRRVQHVALLLWNIKLFMTRHALLCRLLYYWMERVEPGYYWT